MTAHQTANPEFNVTSLSKPKHHRLHALMLLAVLGVLFLLLSNSFASSGDLVNEINNFGHIVLFGTFSIGLLLWIKATQQKRIPNTGMQYLLAFIAALVIATFVEFLQVFGSRSADLIDALRNAVGVSAFLGCYALFDSKLERVQRLNRGVKALCLALLLIFPGLALVPVYKALHFEYLRFAQLPVLIGFDDDWAYSHVRRLRANIVPLKHGPQAGWGRAQFQPDRFASLVFKKFWRRWGSYSRLRIELISEADQAENLSVLIVDKDYVYEFEDAYRHDAVLQPGANTITIDLHDVKLGPQARELKMNGIEAIELFRASEPRRLSIRIKRLVFE